MISSLDHDDRAVVVVVGRQERGMESTLLLWLLLFVKFVELSRLKWVGSVTCVFLLNHD